MGGKGFEAYSKGWKLQQGSKWYTILVTAFNPVFKNLPQAIRRNYELLTICRGTGINQKFSSGPFVSFRCMRKLKKHKI